MIRDAARTGARQLDDPHSPEQIWRNVAVFGGGARREKQAGGVIMRVGIRGGARNMQKYGEFKGKGKGNPGGDTWYWRLVEFGTSRTAAKPFMRPAMNNNAGKAAQVIFQGMEYEFNKEAGKLVRTR